MKNKIKKIFSVTNSHDRTHKIWTVLGCKIKIKKQVRFSKGTSYVSATLTMSNDVKYDKKTAIVFGMYTSNGLFPKNTIEYLTELKKYADYLIVIGDCPIFKSELYKLSGLADAYIFKRHNEYDFGSYKRGFQYLLDKEILNNVDNLVFCNDSVAYLGKSLNEVFNQIKVNDFYGITINNGGFSKNLKLEVEAPHVQSYFVSVSSEIFSKPFFENFMHSIKHFHSKNEIIYNYEQGLSRLVLEHGYSLNSYYPRLKVNKYFEPCHYYLNENSNFKGVKFFYKNSLVRVPITITLNENEVTSGQAQLV